MSVARGRDRQALEGKRYNPGEGEGMQEELRIEEEGEGMQEELGETAPGPGCQVERFALWPWRNRLFPQSRNSTPSSSLGPGLGLSCS